MERTDEQIKRESLKAAVVESLRKRKATLLKTACKTASDLNVFDGPEDYLLEVSIELVIVSNLLKHLEQSTYDPFLEYEVQYPEYRTTYIITDEDIDIIASDMNMFVLKTIRHLYNRLCVGTMDVLNAHTIQCELITVFDRTLASTMKEFRP